MIKWILFDQGGVQTKSLFTSKKEYEINGKVFSAKKLESIFDEASYSQFMTGKVNEDKLIKEFLNNNKILLSINEYKTILKSAITANEGMHELLTNLKKNYKLGALINEGKEWAYYKLEVPDLKKYFDKLVISGEIGLTKPNIDFFEKSLHLINAKPEECIFIDDKKENCLAAESTGIKSIVFENAEQLKSELKKHNIKL